MFSILTAFYRISRPFEIKYWNFSMTLTILVTLTFDLTSNHIDKVTHQGHIYDSLQILTKSVLQFRGNSGTFTHKHTHTVLILLLNARDIFD